MSDTVKIISWNIHRGRGSDGEVNPDRVLQALRHEVWQSEADALFLQEADAEMSPQPGILDPAHVEQITGLEYRHKDRRLRLSEESHGFQGVVCYLHPNWHVEDVRLLDLPGMCPRGAVVIDATKDDRPLRFIATHLSLGQPLRVVQMRTIGQHLKRFEPRQSILCGDLNEWRSWGGLAFLERVTRQSWSGPAQRSFPARYPLFPLDRVLNSGPGEVLSLTPLDGPTIRHASDHRPILAEVRLGD